MTTTTTTETVTEAQVREAIKHAQFHGFECERRMSALAACEDACAYFAVGDLADAMERALFSLEISVGRAHTDYQRFAGKVAA